MMSPTEIAGTLNTPSVLEKRNDEAELQGYVSLIVTTIVFASTVRNKYLFYLLFYKGGNHI